MKFVSFILNGKSICIPVYMYFYDDIFNLSILDLFVLDFHKVASFKNLSLC